MSLLLLSQQEMKIQDPCISIGKEQLLISVRKALPDHQHILTLFAGHLDEHSQKLIMGHKRSDTFSHYIQIQDDTQSAFMGTPTRDALMKLAINKDLTQDPTAPQELSNARKQEIEKDKELNNLIAHHDEFRTQLIAIHHQLQKEKHMNL